jgi:transposase
MDGYHVAEVLGCGMQLLGNFLTYFLRVFIMSQNTSGMQLRDDQWKKLEPFLKGTPNGPGTSGKNNRLFIEALLWLVSNNYAWSNLPAHFGKFNALYMRFRRWTESDFWRELAYEKNDDAELRQMLEQIIRYGDWYTQRREQRLVRKAHRTNYDARRAATPHIRTLNNFQVEATESNLHWVGLVASQ